MEPSTLNGAALITADTDDATPKGPRPLSDILADLRKPIPRRFLKTLTLKGNQITFCPWHRVCKIIDHYTDGRWHYEVRDKQLIGEGGGASLLLTVRITIEAADITVYREGTGIEALDMKGYGDAQSNAEAQAFKRAAAKFGLGLHLYEKEA